MNKLIRNQKIFGTYVQTSQEYLQKILERLLFQNWRYHWYPNVSKEERQWAKWQTYKKSGNYLELMCKHCRNVSRKFEKDSSSWSGDIIYTLISVRKWGLEQTDRHTRNLKLFGTSVQTSQECLQKIWES